MKKIMLTGCGGSASVNFLDSLRMTQEKIHVVGIDINKYFIELSAADKKYLVPACNSKDYIDKVNEIIRKEKIEFVHPQPDPEVKVISDNRDRIEARTMLPGKATIDLCMDKMKLNKELEKSGVPVPLSIQLRTKSDAAGAIEKALERFGGKVWIRAIRGAGSKAALPVKAPHVAEAWIDFWEWNEHLKPSDFMIAEYLPGKEFAFQSLWKDGELITSQARQRVAYVFGAMRPSGQSSSPSIAVTVNRDDVNEICTKAVQSIDKEATGIFCVDLKENTKGVPCVTEINLGRFFTTSKFFSQAGSNMPYYFIKMGYGENLPKLKKYNPIQEGLYWVRLIDCGQTLMKEPA